MRVQLFFQRILYNVLNFLQFWLAFFSKRFSSKIYPSFCLEKIIEITNLAIVEIATRAAEVVPVQRWIRPRPEAGNMMIERVHRIKTKNALFWPCDYFLLYFVGRKERSIPKILKNINFFISNSARWFIYISISSTFFALRMDGKKSKLWCGGKWVLRYNAVFVTIRARDYFFFRWLGCHLEAEEFLYMGEIFRKTLPRFVLRAVSQKKFSGFPMTP